MSTPERSISHLQRELKHDDGTLIELVSDFYAQKPDEVFANEKFEYNTGALQLIELLHDFLSTSRDDPESWRTAYSAFHFAIEASSVASNSSPRLDMAAFVREVSGIDASDLRGYITEMGENYFNHNADAYGLVMAYQDMIDRSGEQWPMAEAIAGFVLEMIRRSETAEDVDQGGDVALTRPAIDSLATHERQLYRNANDWKEAMVTTADALLPLAVETFEEDNGRKVDLASKEDSKEIAEMMRTWFLHKWTDFEGHLTEDDLVIVRGEGIFQPYQLDPDGANGRFQVEVSGSDTEIRGVFKGFDVQPYVDKAILDFCPENKPDLVAAYTRRYGVHIVLEEVLVTGDKFENYPLDSKYVYIPLHYPDMELLVVGNKP